MAFNLNGERTQSGNHSIGARVMEIPKFLHRRTFDVLMYGYVDAIVSNFPSVGIRKAIEMFRGRYELGEDWSEETAYSTYQRMRAELRTYGKERKAAD